MRRFLLLSFALHLVLTAAFLGSRRRAVPPEPEAVMVELPPEPAPEPAAARPSPRQGASHLAGATRAKNPENFSFSSLAPRHSETYKPLRPGEITTSAPAPNSLSPYAASDDVFAGAAQTGGALAWVYRKAELTIGYPAPFIRHDITGNATARLVFDSSGRLKPELLHVEGDSAYLRVYVYRTLESTFRESVPANLVRWKDTLEVFCFVKFSFTEATELKVASTPILGNKLFFARRTVKSAAEKLRWNLGPLNGVGPIPLVGVDMLWFARKAEELQHPLRTQAEADDLAPWRRDPLFNQI